MPYGDDTDAYIVYFFRKWSLLKGGGTRPPKELSKEILEMWHNEPDEVKVQYDILAKEKMEECIRAEEEQGRQDVAFQPEVMTVQNQHNNWNQHVDGYCPANHNPQLLANFDDQPEVFENSQYLGSPYMNGYHVESFGNQQFLWHPTPNDYTNSNTFNPQFMHWQNPPPADGYSQNYFGEVNYNNPGCGDSQVDDILESHISPPPNCDDSLYQTLWTQGENVINSSSATSSSENVRGDVGDTPYYYMGQTDTPLSDFLHTPDYSMAQTETPISDFVHTPYYDMTQSHTPFYAKSNTYPTDGETSSNDDTYEPIIGEWSQIGSSYHDECPIEYEDEL